MLSCCTWQTVTWLSRDIMSRDVSTRHSCRSAGFGTCLPQPRNLWKNQRSDRNRVPALYKNKSRNTALWSVLQEVTVM